MLLLRSAFWLILAFMVMRPGLDMGSTATALKNEAVATGQRLAVAGVQSFECTDLACAAGKAVLLAAASPSPAATAGSQLAAQSAPQPRPRIIRED